MSFSSFSSSFSVHHILIIIKCNYLMMVAKRFKETKEKSKKKILLIVCNNIIFSSFDSFLSIQRISALLKKKQKLLR